MEHRQGQRKMVDFRAIAESTVSDKLHVKISDVSLTGLHIKGPTHQLPVYSPLLLRFQLRRNGGMKTYSWRGYVVRVAGEGVGAMFESSDPVDQQGLLALLEAADEERGEPLRAGSR
jgi:hypothetical protein